jgi:predicted dinucleotide-binding enzyme
MRIGIIGKGNVGIALGTGLKRPDTISNTVTETGKKPS